MKIAFVSSEAVPFAKTGGLADVAGSLPKALERLGCEVKLFLPKYSAVDEAKFGLHYLWDIGEIPIRINNHVRYHPDKLRNASIAIARNLPPV